MLTAVAIIATCAVVPAVPAAAGPSVDVYAYGSAPALGAPDQPLAGRIVDIAANPAGTGYWLLGLDGGVFSYGVDFYGSTGGLRLNAPVIGMAPTPTGRGYWFVAQDGGIFSYGDARFAGSTASFPLQAPIVAMAATPSGNGYWIVSSDGAVFAFGDAQFRGGLAGVFTGQSIVSIAPTPTGNGYVLLGDDGGVFSFGDAAQFTTWPMAQGARDVAITPSGQGLWMLGTDGAVFTYGDAPFHGAATDSGRNGVAISATPAGTGYWIAAVPRDADGPPVPSNSGSGRRIVYSNSMQRVWLVEGDGRVAHTYLVSGRRGVPNPGTYSVFSKSVMSSAGSLRLPYMTRFAHGRSLAIGFHGIPLRSNGSPIQSDDELGQYRSHGCVRMNQDAVKVLYDWAPVGTVVVVLA